MLCVVSDEAEHFGGTFRYDSSVSHTIGESDDNADHDTYSGSHVDDWWVCANGHGRIRDVCVVGGVEGDSSSGVLVMAVYSRCAELREHLQWSIDVGVVGSGVLELSGGIDLGGRVSFCWIYSNRYRFAHGSDGSGSECE